MHPELIDFADKKYGTRIHTDAITVDSCGAENLLNKEQLSFHQSRCFMTEYYIKCPVEIVITLPCLVHISAIVIEPKVSSHRSKCIELFSVFQKIQENNGSTSHAGKSDHSVKSKSENVASTSCAFKSKLNQNKHETDYFPCTYVKDFSSRVTRDESKHFLNLTGKYKDHPRSASSPSCIVFYNPQHPNQFSKDLNSEYIQMRSYISTKACSYLVIKITWATIPVINRLQIWGTPSSFNPINLKNKFDSFISKFLDRDKNVLDKPISIPVKEQINRDCNLEGTSSLNETNESDVNTSDIPDEFIDPITFSLMTVPMLLPSGNTIDRLTLDKYVIEEEKFGRLPSDPFTGVIFHGLKQPIPNSSLKSRIDKFILKNDEKLNLTSQTTGSSDNRTKKTMNELSKQWSQKSTQMTLQHNKLMSSREVSSHEQTRPSSSNVEGNVCKTSTGNHEDKLKDSLDLALQSILPAGKKRKLDCETKEEKCKKCSNDNKLSLLTLPCQHLFCRICLQNMLSDNKQCFICSTVFQWTDAVKLVSTFRPIGGTM